MRELKHLRQSNLLQLDISRRDSVVDQRRQSFALDVSKTKNQLHSLELSLQLKMEEVENLTYELSRSQVCASALKLCFVKETACLPTA